VLHVRRLGWKAPLVKGIVFAVIITVKTRGACVIARSYPGIGPRVRLVDGPVWAELMRNVMVLSRPSKCKVRDRVGSI